MLLASSCSLTLKSLQCSWVHKGHSSSGKDSLQGLHKTNSIRIPSWSCKMSADVIQSEVGTSARLKKKARMGKKNLFSYTTFICLTPRIFPSNLNPYTFLILLLPWLSRSLSVPIILDIRHGWCSELERESGMRWNKEVRGHMVSEGVCIESILKNLVCILSGAVGWCDQNWLLARLFWMYNGE